jgi:sRNA-binding protein
MGMGLDNYQTRHGYEFFNGYRYFSGIESRPERVDLKEVLLGILNHYARSHFATQHTVKRTN